IDPGIGFREVAVADHDPAVAGDRLRAVPGLPCEVDPLKAELAHPLAGRPDKGNDLPADGHAFVGIATFAASVAVAIDVGRAHRCFGLRIHRPDVAARETDLAPAEAGVA